MLLPVIIIEQVSNYLKAVIPCKYSATRNPGIEICPLNSKAWGYI